MILLAILSTAVIAQALKLRQQAQDSAAMATLRSAASAARGVYSITLPGGTNNFAADGTATAASLVGFSDVAAASAEAARLMQAQEPAINFIAKNTFGTIKGADPNVSKVWVHLPSAALESTAAITVGGSNPKGFSATTHGLATTVPDDTKIRAGDVIRIGLVGASGSSFCSILVQDSSNGAVSGEGHQSVNESATLAGWGADCGAFTSGNDIFEEMPGTTGTDPSLLAPNGKVQAATSAYGGYATPEA
ncbi:MAG: hypothetical protein OXP08_08520 [bacterium]|nr:hypothetical protein [bacterium]